LSKRGEGVLYAIFGKTAQFDRSIILHRVCLLVIISMCMFPTYICVAGNGDRAPFWFERGVYAEYKFKTRVIIFLNRTCIFFPDETAEASYRWECIDLKGNLAEIEVTLLFRIGDIDIRSYATRLYVNIENRDVILLNGTLVGKTWLWLPANPKLHECGRRKGLK